MIAVAMRFCIGVAVMIGMLQLVPSAPAILTVMIAVRCQTALPICTASQAVTHVERAVTNNHPVHITGCCGIICPTQSGSGNIRPTNGFHHVAIAIIAVCVIACLAVQIGNAF